MQGFGSGNSWKDDEMKRPPNPMLPVAMYYPQDDARLHLLVRHSWIWLSSMYAPKEGDEDIEPKRAL
ncbi:hypothetical protein AMTR_s00042p00174850 [Amborella trichopoda]|uniref:Uncharacterized protein n=1 Tax=Amborella trichopoda TaxID=13333 RepID=W1P7M3_AMBTC|nr:hypothetical protein AMTR_s00042p00174850 [Amborella trichopoda]